MAKLTQKGKLLLGWGKVALTFAWLRQPADACTAGLAGQTGVMHAGPWAYAVVRNDATPEAWHFYGGVAGQQWSAGLDAAAVVPLRVAFKIEDVGTAR